MTCPSCGLALESGAEHCPRCGASAEGLCPLCAAELSGGGACAVCGGGGEREGRRCPSCDAEVAADERYCPDCFTALGPGDRGAEALAAGRACPRCGETNAPGADRCLACWAPLSAREPPAEGARGDAPREEAPTQLEALRRCPLCGYENPDAAEFCGACWGRLPRSFAEVSTRIRMVVDETLAERWEVHGVKTGFIGRSRELAVLSQLFEETVRNRQGQLVTVLGEAGIGKSRLFAELLGWLREHPSGVRVLAAVCREDEPVAFLGPLARLLRERFDLREQDDAAAAARKVREAVAALGSGAWAEETATLLSKFLGLTTVEDPSAAAEDEHEPVPAGTYRLLGAVSRFLEGDARLSPLVLCLDDLHNAAPSVLAALRHVLASVHDAPLFAVVLARPGLLVRSPEWLGTGVRHFRLDVGPLSPEESEHLVRGILGAAAFSDARVREAVRRAGGNPLFLEELCRIALEEGPSSVHALPRDVDEAVRTRLARVDEPARRVLEMASVVGRVFWIGALVCLRRLEAMATDDEAATTRYWFGLDESEEIRRALEALRSRDLVARNPQSTFPDEEEYRFQQAKVRELLYADVPRERAARWHRLLSMWILQRRGGAEEERFAQAARHRELAGDVVGAARLYLAAADRARSTRDPERAAEFYEHGLALLPAEEVATRLAVLHGLGDALTRAGEYDRALARFREMLRCAWLLGDRGKSGAAYNRIGRIHRHLGRYDAAMAALSDGHTLFLEARDWRGVAASLDDIGQVHRRRGEYDQAIYYFQEALQLRREIGDPRGMALSLYNLGEIQRDAGKLREAEAHLEEALDLIRKTTDRTGVASVLSALAALLHERRELDRAQALWREALAIALEIGDRHAEGRIRGRMGELCLEQGDLAGARELLTEALDLIRAVEDRATLPAILRALGETYLREGDVERARELCEESLRIAEEIGSRLDQGVALRVLGETHAQTIFDDAAGGGDARAEAYLARAVAIFEEMENDLELGRALTSHGNFLLERGQMERGKALLLRARELLEQHEAARSLARAERTLGELG